MLTRRLHGGNATGFGRRGLNQTGSRTTAVTAHVDVIAYKMEKCSVPYKVPGAEERMAVAERLCLRSELHTMTIGNRIPEENIISGRDHDANIVDSGAPDLIDQKRQDRPVGSVPIDYGLQRQPSLTLGRCCDYCLLDEHAISEDSSH
jgi:hypothetical protein